MATHFGGMAERLSRLSPESRLAFAAACAERTLSVYEADSYPGAETGIAALRQAIEFIWRTLATGECPVEKGLAVRASAEASLPSREESSDGGVYLPTSLAAITALEALDTALGNPSASVAKIAQSSLDAFDAFFEVAGTERGSRYEEAWQEAALSALEALGARLPQSDLFLDLGVPATELEIEEED